MVETDPQHPGRDQELAERFALGRLSPPERATVEAHLRECEECRGLVERELRIAAGVRRAGREELVNRLRARLRQTRGAESRGERARRIPWPRVAAIAASLLILAGIGIVRLWLLPDGNETRIPEISQQMSEKSTDSDFAPAPAPSGTIMAGKGKSTNPSRAKSPPRENEAIPAPAQAARPAIVEERLEDALRDKEKADAGIMVEGTIVDQMAASEESGLKKERKDAIQLTQRVGDAATNAAGNVAANAAQYRQERSRNILTRMQNVNNQLQITLYPETLFTDEMLRNARIEPFGKDSLRVTIGNQMILYRIPQQVQQTTPAR